MTATEPGDADRPRWSAGRITRVRGAVSLLSSGVVAAVGLVVLARGWFPGLERSLASAVVLFIQWEALLLTCCKWGLDQLVFAKLAEEPDATPRIRAHVLYRSVPIAFVGAAIMSRSFGPVASAILAITALVDTVATIRLSALAAHSRYRDVSIANILNYPVFFALLAGGGMLGRVDVASAAAFFLCSSVARLLWVSAANSRYGAVRPIRIDASLGLGAQQALNFLVFRSDQVLLPLLASVVFAGAEGHGVVDYVFLSRIPELASSVLVTVAPALMPPLYDRFRRAGFPGSGLLLLSLAGWASCLPLTWLYSRFGSDPAPPLLLVAFAAAAALALPANLMTYALLRENRLPALLRGLLGGVTIASLSIAVAVLRSAVSVYAATVPLALCTFVFLAHHYRKTSIDGRRA